MQKKQILYQNMLDLLQRAWVRFRSKEPATEGTNLCAFYVAESIMSRGQRTYSSLSDSIGGIGSLKKINTKLSKKY
uniref:Uncharacterized protein n=1 Tax=Leersia perrieri TaxID=77586 RepID=A0A0D9WV48_9ORYZ